MLLTIDIGNTSTVIGVFEKDKLLKSFRIGTTRARTADEYGIILLNLFHLNRIDITRLEGAAISCVVPELLDTFIELILKYFYIEPLVVNHENAGIPILMDNPKEVGADRIVNAVAGYEIYRKALIVVDLGTAITFDYVTGKGEYAGGVIAPGITIAIDALFHKTSKLPRVEVRRPERVIGKDTVSGMQSGFFYGYLSLIDGVVDRMRKEVGTQPKVLATGGLARLFGNHSSVIEEVIPDLTLQGLRIIYQRNMV